MPGLGERDQSVRCAAFELNVRLEPSEAAGRVEGPAKPEPAVQKKQWIGREATDLDGAAAAER